MNKIKELKKYINDLAYHHAISGGVCESLIGKLDNISKSDFEPLVMQKRTDIEEKYSELIMAAASKYPDETRHETALRYIKEAEIFDDSKTGNNSSELSA